MGIIAVLLYSQGHLDGQFHIPFWVVIARQTAMGLGTLMGGWNVASSIVYAWVITIPASAIVAALTYWAVLRLR